MAFHKSLQQDSKIAIISRTVTLRTGMRTVILQNTGTGTVNLRIIVPELEPELYF